MREPMYSDCPAIAVVTSDEWNQLCAYAQAHDVERGKTDDDCLAEYSGTIQVCHIMPPHEGPSRMGLTRTAYSVEDPPDTPLSQHALAPELVNKLTAPSAGPLLLVRIMDLINPSPEEEAAEMPVAEATLYFYRLFHQATGTRYS